jgi:light-regulated signal transduction histidine kinase (bacteriophytochrome)
MLWFSTKVVPIKYDKDVVSVIMISTDITERKRAEEVLRTTLTELERSNRDLEQFAYVASHDLQEPLRTVTSYVQLLERRYKGKLDPDADEFIGFAVEGANRMQRRIQDLLSYSRLSTRGKSFQPTNMEKMLEAAIANLSAAIATNHAVIEHEPLPTIIADESQLSQVLQNLIDNGMKFHRKDVSPQIHISAKREKDEWEFSVRDNGIGIDPSHFKKMFIIFQRLHGPQEYPGTGIGLAICKKIVERHGGRIWVESEPGKGSTFRFTIPLTPYQGGGVDGRGKKNATN